MNKIQSAKIVLAGLMLASATQTFTFEITPKKVALTIGFVAFGYLVTKDEPDPDHLTITKGFKGLYSKSERKTNFVNHLVRLVDHVLIGYTGKKRGIKPFGHKVIIEGDEKLIDTKVGKNGTKIEIYKYDNCPPYGIMGIAWAYIKPILGALKDVKDIIETSDKFRTFDFDKFEFKKP